VPLDRISLKPLVNITADKPETTAAFPASQEIVVESNPNLTPNPNPPHNQMQQTHMNFTRNTWSIKHN